MLLTLYMLLIKEAAVFITDYLHPLNFFTVIKTKIHLEGYRSITLAKFMIIVNATCILLIAIKKDHR